MRKLLINIANKYFPKEIFACQLISAVYYCFISYRINV